MQVNFDAIKEKVQRFIDSNEGQELIDGLAIPEGMMIEAGEIMRNILRERILSGSYGKSIDNIANSGIIVSPPYESGKKGKRTLWSIDIDFDPTMLHRDSLQIRRKGRIVAHTGRGIDNIMSLLDTGYPYSPSAQMKSVRGFWESRWVTIMTPLERAGDHFMSDAVNEFNTVYGSEYFCTARISAPKEYYMRISDNN